MRLGTWSLIPSAHVVELLGKAGFDFVVLDAEHGGIGLHETLLSMIRACTCAKTSPWVRVPAKEGWMVGQVLDAGAAEVVVPDIRNAEQARAMVESASYAAKRGACPFARSAYDCLRSPHTPWAEVEKAHDEGGPGIYALVESAEGVKNMEEIAQVPGLKGLMVGPMDLSVDLGLHGDLTHPQISDAVALGVQVALRAGIEPVVPVFNGSLDEDEQMIRKWQAQGVQTFTSAVDKSLLMTAAVTCNRRLRGS